MNHYTATNQQNWDERVAHHMDSTFYNLAEFKRTRCSLLPLELQEVGDDVVGKTFLHLQCHFGMDTLSWADRGAIVTGVDFSTEAIHQARKLADELAIDARFIQCDLYDLPLHLTTKFDIVYTTYGVLCWLNDLSQWATIIANLLASQGIQAASSGS